MITHAELKRIELIVQASREETRSYQAEYHAWKERMRKLYSLKQEPSKCKASIP